MPRRTESSNLKVDRSVRGGALTFLVTALLVTTISLFGCETSTLPEIGTSQPERQSVETTEAQFPSWVELQPSTSPSPRFGSLVLADQEKRRLLLIGGTVAAVSGMGASSEVWEWSEHDRAWQLLSLKGFPRPPIGSQAVVDDTRGVGLLVLPGGQQGKQVTSILEYNPDQGSWEVASEALPYRIAPSVAYVSSERRVFLFGGLLGGNESWIYDPVLRRWEEVRTVGNAPSPRMWASMVYDASSGKVILFGGKGEAGNLSDTWTYDPAHKVWTDMSPSGRTPRARFGASMIFHADSGRILLFGGSRASSMPGSPGGEDYDVLGDMWAYDVEANAWTEITVPMPPARAFASMMYDQAQASVILFGGYGSEGPLGDTWSLKAIDRCLTAAAE